MKHLYVMLTLFVLSSYTGNAQLSKGGTPFEHNQNHLKSSFVNEIINIKKPNIDSLLNLIQETDNKSSIAAVACPVNKDIVADCPHWETENGQVYETTFEAPGADGLMVYFSAFSLPVGAMVFVYNKMAVLGAFTHSNNKGFGSLTIQEIPGNNVTVQLFVPFDKISQVKLKVGNIGYGFKSGLNDIYHDGFGMSLPCNLDINSDYGMFHQKEKRSVVAVTHLEYQFYVRYSAVLINNFNNDGTPYFLTARHCFEKAFTGGEFHPEYAETAVAHFGYESPVSGQNGDWTKTISGAELLCYADSSDYDLVLMKFSEVPPLSYDSFYAGVKAITPEVEDQQYNEWNVVGNETFTAIHHPGGDVKKITWYERVINIKENSISLRDNTGLTEGGSSGCPLFDKEHFVVGVLSGGSEERNCNLSDRYSDVYATVEKGYTLFPEMKQYIFGDDGVKKIYPYQPFDENQRLMFYPNSFKIDLGEKKFSCQNVSTGNYSNFRWDFGKGAVPRYFEGTQPPDIELQELGFYTVTLTAYNSSTGKDEVFTCENLIESRYGKPYPYFYITNEEGQVINGNCQLTDTLYIHNQSQGFASGFVFSLEVADFPYTVYIPKDTFYTFSLDEMAVIPPFLDISKYSDNEIWNGKEIRISMLQLNPDKDSTYSKLVRVHQPTVADFDFDVTHHFNPGTPGDYYIVNETEIITHGKSEGYSIFEDWYLDDELKYSGRKGDDFSFIPSEPGIHELKLIAHNDFSKDSISLFLNYHLTTGINEINIESLNVYPTITQDIVSVNATDKYVLQIFNILGQSLKDETIFPGKSDIDISLLPNGVYLFCFKGNERKGKTFKIIKQ